MILGVRFATAKKDFEWETMKQKMYLPPDSDKNKQDTLTTGNQMTDTADEVIEIRGVSAYQPQRIPSKQ